MRLMDEVNGWHVTRMRKFPADTVLSLKVLLKAETSLTGIDDFHARD